MCSAVVWNWLCSCPSARLPEPGPSLTLGQSPDPKILPQEGGTEQSTGSSRYLSICPWPPYLASFFTRRGQTRFLLSFISISNMMSQREIICKGAGGSLHVAGLGGLGGVRKKRLQAWGKWKKRHPAWDRGRGAGAGTKLFCFQSCCTPQQELGEGTREQNGFRFSGKL